MLRHSTSVRRQRRGRFRHRAGFWIDINNAAQNATALMRAARG
jgi:hypothetical protein